MYSSKAQLWILNLSAVKRYEFHSDSTLFFAHTHDKCILLLLDFSTLSH